MVIIIEVLIFIVSIFLLTWLNASLVKNLTKLAKYFGLKEFIVAFFVFLVPVSLPNLFIDVGAALRGLPQIAIGDMIGGNLVDLTIVIAIAAFFSKKYISADSKIVQGSALFTFFIALFPLMLLLKGEVTRIDGIILIVAFIIYNIWVFSKDDRFRKEYSKSATITKFEIFKVLFKMAAVLILLFFISQQIINGAVFFSEKFGFSLSLVAIIIVGLANCFPEIYLSIVSVRSGEDWMVLGDIMSSVVGSSTLVFGIVALIHPFAITDISQLLVARVFLVIASIFFLVSIRSGKKITKREGLFLLCIYIAFLIAEIFIKF